MRSSSIAMKAYNSSGLGNVILGFMLEISIFGLSQISHIILLYLSFSSLGDSCLNFLRFSPTVLPALKFCPICI